MSVGQKRVPGATAADLLAIPEAERVHEIIGGEIIGKARPSGPHALGQSQIVAQVGGPFNRRAGGRGPGGW